MARKCSGGVPYRYNGNELMVLIVRSKDKQRWVLPKGGVDAGLSKRENAIKEIVEEAGVVGELGSRLATYVYEKDGETQLVFMYALRVVVELDTYPESGSRKRRWVPVKTAITELEATQAAIVERLALVATPSVAED